MRVPGLRSSYEKVGGIVFFGRMLDKIRFHAAGRLPPGYNLGTSNWSWFKFHKADETDETGDEPPQP